VARGAWIKKNVLKKLIKKVNTLLDLIPPMTMMDVVKYKMRNRRVRWK
jgi:hypothetical protein